MRCIIKKLNNDSYFNKNIGFQNHWTFRDEAKEFESVADARAIIKKYKLKEVEVKKIKKGRK